MKGIIDTVEVPQLRVGETFPEMGRLDTVP